MPARTRVTEQELKAYAHVELGELAALLGFTVDGGSYDPVVQDALGTYGVEEVTEVAGVSQVMLLLACTRLALWRRVTSLTNGKFNLADDGSNLSLAQINEHARASAKDATEECAFWQAKVARETGASAVTLYDVTRPDDPYAEAVDGNEFSA